ncbi:uncharacterized protein LOC131736355 isoform X1 [Acipenser ruthenus]|uniref:uncharacterized protein LOC131736355 isoform X1 n=1 Tax=Acipenser ruthenus TaxID=7906 RepID=UPI002741FDC5|nr:uncharacterized protein LOC131736355 isoform X1 [Acipenser ruthenus]
MVLLRTLSLVIGGLCYCLQACAGSNPADQQVNRLVGGNATLTIDNLQLGEDLIWCYNGTIIAMLLQNGSSKEYYPAKYELDSKTGSLTIIHPQKNDSGDYEAEIPKRRTKKNHHLGVCDVSVPCVPIRSGYGTVTILYYVENDSNGTQTTSVNGTALELLQEIAEDNATFTSIDLNKEDNFITKNPYFIPVIVVVVAVMVVVAVYHKKVMRAFSKCFERSRNMEDAEAGQGIPLQALTGSESPDPLSVNAGVVQRDPPSQLPECTVLIQEGNHQVDGRN